MTAPDAFSPELADGTYLLQAALASGMSIELFPRQVMVCWRPDTPEERHAFVHGIPGDSTLSGVTYAQDKRVVRALLQRARVTTTKGATFSFRGKGAALRYADRIGYPVTLRMAIDDSIRTVAREAISRADLESAMDDLRRLRKDSMAAATNLRRSAYSLTGLLEPVEAEEGDKLFAPSTRVLIERIPAVPTVHALVVDGEVVAAIESPPAGDGADAVDVTATLTDKHRLAVLRAATAVPGLRIAHIVLLKREPNRFLRRGPFLIQDVSERLGLDLFDRARAGWAEALAKRILDDRGRAEEGPLALTVTFEGVSDIDTLTASLPADATVVTHDLVEGQLSCELQGPPGDLAEFLMLVSTLGLKGARAMFLEAAERPRK